MEKLNYKVLENSGYQGYILKSAPEKVLQFGEGNFLRGFVDYWLDMANELVGWNGKVVVVKPRPYNGGVSVCDLINEQEGLYTLYLRGRENGEKVDRKRVISSISRCVDPHTDEGFQALMAVAVSDELEYVVSNTTEAGIAFDPACKLEDKPAASYPGKLTQVLYARYKAGKPGVTLMPCELIDYNGRKLKSCVLEYVKLWGLEDGFKAYIEQKCTFCSTLVDRIVSGRIRDAAERARLEQENGFSDEVAVVGEIFGTWVIEGTDALADQLPFKKAGLNCPVVPDVAPYKKRKVHILNGAHTGFVLGAHLAGFDIVREGMENATICDFLNRMLYNEVIPTLPLDKEDLVAFAAAVQDRFNNPFVDHALMSISLNSTSKWKERNLPSLLEYVRKEGKLPACLSFGLAAYIAFFSNDIQELNEQGLVCRRPKGDLYTCSDDRSVLEFYYAHRNDSVEALVHAVMTNTELWGIDLTKVEGLEAVTVENLARIRREGALAAFKAVLDEAAC